MRILRAALLAAVCLVCMGARGGGSPGAKDEAAVRRVNDELRVVFLTADKAALNRLLAADYIVTHPTGEVETKADFVKRLLPASPSTEAKYAHDQYVFRLYGNTALLNFRNAMTGRRQSDRKEITVWARVTEYYVKRRGKWQCAARHESLLEEGLVPK